MCVFASVRACVRLSLSLFFFTFIPPNAWTYFNETYHGYSLPGPNDTDDIFKVMGSKVKVTKTFSG